MTSDAELGGPWPDALPAHAPTVFRNLDVGVGGRQLTTLTRDHLCYWLGKLRYIPSGPFITMKRAGQAPMIQAYRNSDTDYDFEVHPRTGEGEYRYLRTNLTDVNEVEQLLWDWLQNQWQRLDAIDWDHCTL